MSRVIIVGNGSSLLERENGKIIDEFDVVVRFNSYKTRGYEVFVGEKTSIWFTVNASHVDKIFDKVYVHSWQYDPKKCEVYKEVYRKIPCLKITKKDADNTGLEYPSTGLIAIFKMLESFDFVTITGFDWWGKEEHHYGDNELRGSLHDPKKEYEVIKKLESNDKLFFL